MEAIKPFGSVPVNYSTLRAVFSAYKVPRNKIFQLEKSGRLIRLKKGLFVVSPDLSGSLLSVELIANHLYGPSYVSMESALWHYGLIPEQVYTIRSMTFNRSKVYENRMGAFQYITVNEAYFSIGIRLETVEKYTFMIASPEKALCDMITSTHGLYLQSIKAVSEYLEEDLRFDMPALQEMNVNIIEQCMAVSKKKNALSLLLKFLQR